jgi:hypothetical protein
MFCITVQYSINDAMATKCCYLTVPIAVFCCFQHFDHLLQWGRTFQHYHDGTRKDLDTELEYRQDAHALPTQCAAARFER